MFLTIMLDKHFLKNNKYILHDKRSIIKEIQRDNWY